MKRIVVFLLSFFIILPYASAHSANIKGYGDKNSKYISSCNKKYYGYHKQNGNNHWHEVTFKNDEWTIVDSKKVLKSDPCEKNEKIKVTFIRCVDGDTAVLKINGSNEKFRFLGVDTPESVHPAKDVEQYAKEASKNTCDLLTNASSIKVEYDLNSDKKDKYNRNLAWIWIDDILLQELMISEGFARVAYVYGNYKYTDKLCSLQNNAISNNKGIWQYGYEVGYCETKDTSNKEVSKNNIYTVTFKDGEDKTDVAVAEGMKVKEIKASGKTGFDFAGWYHDGKKYNFNNPVESNIILEAKYKIDYIYVIVFIVILLSSISYNAKEKKNGKNNKKSTKRN